MASPPQVPARQARSRQTAERIVAAGLALFGEKGFDATSVAEICTRAGVSVGGFYARFEGKAALLEFLYATVLDQLVVGLRERFDPQRVAGLGARELVRLYIDFAVRSFRAHRDVMRQVALRGRTSDDPAFRQRIRDLNRAVHGVFRERLEEHHSRFAHGDPSLAVDLALTAVSGAMREYVLFGDERPQFDPVHDERLIEELTLMFAAYTGMPA